jgi:hypothetical protein
MDQRTNDENASLGNESASADAASNVGAADDDDDDYVDTVMNESLPADLQQQESTVDVEAATVETNTLTIRPMTAIHSTGNQHYMSPSVTILEFAASLLLFSHILLPEYMLAIFLCQQIKLRGRGNDATW